MEKETIALIAGRRKKWHRIIPARYVLMFLGFLGFCNVYALRVNLSVALVSMVNHTAIMENKTESHDCPVQNGSNSSLKIKEGEFIWHPKIQGIILGSFFYGYIITQIPGGRMAETFGGRRLFGLGVLGTGVLTLVTPKAAHLHVSALIVVRILEGFGEGVTFPAMHSLLARWIPKTERSTASAWVYSGCQIGTVISLPVAGALCASNILGGWPSVFYLFGIITCVWFIFWILLIHDTPEEHPRISLEELTYIQTNQGNERAHMKPITPWKSILTSGPVWALALAHFGQNCGFYMLLTEMPTYLSAVLRMNIKNNGALSALPYLMQALCNWTFGFVADYVRNRGYASPSVIRKVCNSIGFFGPALCLIGVAFAGCNQTLTISLFVLGMGCNGLVYSGFVVTHIDMSPDFAGTLMGITNAVATIPGFAIPAIVGAMTEKEQSLRVWSQIFFLASGCYIVSNIVFVIFGSAQLQPWGIAKVRKSSCTETSQEGTINGNIAT